MTQFLSILAIGACLWATVDIIQSKQAGLTKVMWVASIWLFSLIALPLYFSSEENQIRQSQHSEALPGEALLD